jgi:cytochrome P450
VKMFSQPLIVLNSFKAAKDLLDTRGAIYSSRPYFVVVTELMGWGDVLVNQPVGPGFRKHRRLIQEHFSPRSLVKFTSLQRKEAYTTLSHIGSSPDDFLKHFKRFCRLHLCGFRNALIPISGWNDTQYYLWIHCSLI